MYSKCEKIGFDAFVYAIYCALIPLNMILNFTGSTINRYVGIVAAVFIGIKVIATKKQIVTSSKTIKIMLLFWIWCFCSYFWSADQESTLNWLITLTSVVALCLVCCFRKFNSRELYLIKYAMMLSSAALVLFLAPNLAHSYTRGTLTTSAGTADQNSLAANLVFALWIAIDLLKTSKGFFKFLCYASIILVIVGLLFLSSRGAILALLISLFVYIFILKKARLNVGTIILLTLACFIIVWILGALEIVAYERLSLQSILEDGATGRFGLWISLINLFFDSNVFRAVFGYGFATEKYVCALATGIPRGAHSVFIEYLMTTGIVGEVLLLSLFGSTLSTANKRKDSIAFVLLISLIVICIPLGFFLDKGAWNIIMLSMIGVEQQDSTPEQK